MSAFPNVSPEAPTAHTIKVRVAGHSPHCPSPPASPPHPHFPLCSLEVSSEGHRTNLGAPTLQGLKRPTAKSLQSCLTLCDHIDGSPPGSPVPGILQARTLEWVAISFSNAGKGKVKVNSLSRVRLLATPRDCSLPGPPSMGFSRQEYWSGVPLPSLLAFLSIPK